VNTIPRQMSRPAVLSADGRPTQCTPRSTSEAATSWSATRAARSPATRHDRHERGPGGSSIIATTDLASIDIGNEPRDNHIHFAGDFELEKYSTMSCRSNGVSHTDGGWVIAGALTLHGVPLAVEVAGPSHHTSAGAPALAASTAGTRWGHTPPTSPRGRAEVPAMLSEREEQILDELEHDLANTGRHRFRAPSLLLGVVPVFGGELVATPAGLVLALIGWFGIVFASAAYVGESRSRPRRRAAQRMARRPSLLGRW
jgi:hypothetical protein